MKNITLSAEQSLLRAARERARKENRSLNELFRQWLHQYVGRDTQVQSFDAIMDSLTYAHTTRSFDRQERNER